MSKAAFVDEAVIQVRGGKGGNGVASFHRTKRQPKGGPDGGDGGAGGSVFAKASSNITTLVDYVYNKNIKADVGKHGSGNRKHGANGKDTYLKFPLGTEIYDEITGNLHASLLTNDQEIILARGGEGGRGNVTFKTSTNRTPKEFTPGEEGEERVFRLSLRLLADVGLIGLPNAGKSSLLNALSNAHSEVDAYPFTTLRPRLGVVDLEDYSQLLVADIPGIVKGASQDVGLGLRFLRHITRAKILLHLVDISSGDLNKIIDTIEEVNTELLASEHKFETKPTILVLTKTDLLDDKQVKKLTKSIQQQYVDIDVFAVSATKNKGLSKLINQANELVKQCV